jgi:hypothetical protein
MVREANEKSCVFSGGMITYGVMCGEIAFKGDEGGEAGKRIVNGERPSLELFEKEKCEFWSVLKDMWEGEAAKRMNLILVLEDTAYFVKSGDEETLTSDSSSGSSEGRSSEID